MLTKDGEYHAGKWRQLQTRRYVTGVTVSAQARGYVRLLTGAGDRARQRRKADHAGGLSVSGAV